MSRASRKPESTPSRLPLAGVGAIMVAVGLLIAIGLVVLRVKEETPVSAPPSKTVSHQATPPAPRKGLEVPAPSPKTTEPPAPRVADPTAIARLRIRVVDDCTGGALSGAGVTVESRAGESQSAGTTGENGRIEVLRPAEDVRDVVVSHPEYITARRRVGAGDWRSEATVRLGLGVTIEFVVSAADERPVGPIRLRVMWMGGSTPHPIDYSVQTFRQGESVRCRVPWDAEIAWIVVPTERTDLASASGNIVVASLADPRVLVQLALGVDLRGVVVDADSKLPIRDAAIEVGMPGGEVASLTTEDDGVFVVRGIDASKVGGLIVTARAPEYEMAQEIASLRSADAVTIGLSRASEGNVRVVDAAGEPQEGVTVDVFDRETSMKRPVFSGLTGPGGLCLCSGLPRQEAKRFTVLAVAKPPNLRAMTTLMTSEWMKKGTVELRLAVADSRLTFRVMRGGQPVEGMRVYATYSDGWGVLGRRRQGGLVTYMPLGVMLRPSEVLEAETDAQGRVEWEGVSSGEYIIETVGVRSRLWKAKAGSSEVTIDIGEALAGETQRIAGTVFDGGKPAQGHAVELWSGERMMSKSVTRPDGAFLLVLQGSFPGPSEIRVGDFRMPVAEVPRTNIVVDLSH